MIIRIFIVASSFVVLRLSTWELIYIAFKARLKSLSRLIIKFSASNFVEDNLYAYSLSFQKISVYCYETWNSVSILFDIFPYSRFRRNWRSYSGTTAAGNITFFFHTDKIFLGVSFKF